jgi:hypothetical protein
VQSGLLLVAVVLVVVVWEAAAVPVVIDLQFRVKILVVERLLNQQQHLPLVLHTPLLLELGE